jgi:hypothetical protein
MFDDIANLGRARLAGADRARRVDRRIGGADRDAGWREAEAIAWIAYGLLAIIGSILLSLGLAINRRSIKLSRDGFEASGGDAG